MKRRNFIKTTGAGSAGLAAMSLPASGMQDHKSKETFAGAVPMIHAADLYHHHGDPDDHWDLASVYALAYSGSVDLKGIVIDWPPRRTFGDPDVMGIAQMNYLTGLVIPSVIGAPHPMKYRNDIQPDANRMEHQGINWIIDTLKKSPSPVVINIVGAATNIALAAKKEPALFKEKCKAIYLNAGIALRKRETPPDYNASLDVSSYAAIFDVPCPLYWLPCDHEPGINEVGEYSSYYKFLQGDILPLLPKRVLNFFLFMLGQAKSHKWLEYLNGEPDQRLLASKGALHRLMWCTAGFLHAAGKKVTAKGDIVPLNSKRASVFSFVPATIGSEDSGHTEWELGEQSPERYILHIDDMTNYEKAITTALKNLLFLLPQG
ncbi:MAG: nucleoside hydrolase [Bacteroidota bacterium]